MAPQLQKSKLIGLYNVIEQKLRNSVTEKKLTKVRESGNIHVT